MAIHETKKQTALEKRLKLLRQQVYGLQQTKPSVQSVKSSSTDLSYLYRDLAKIVLLSTLAMGIQVVLFILTNKHILNLSFF